MKNRNEREEEDRKLFSYKINEKGKEKQHIYYLWSTRGGRVCVETFSRM